MTSRTVTTFRVSRIEILNVYYSNPYPVLDTASGSLSVYVSSF